MKRIFIIDDDFDMAQTMALLLQDEGYNTSAYDDGNLALEGMSKEQPDLVILDVMMPLMRGVDVFKIMKENDQLRSIPILLISASKEPESGEDKWNQYLKKPFDIYRLIEEVRNLIA